MKNIGNLLGAFALIAFTFVTSPIAESKPLKLFILAGQSNMQGHVNVSTFDSMANPLFPFPDRLPSVFSALGEKAIS